MKHSAVKDGWQPLEDDSVEGENTEKMHQAIAGKARMTRPERRTPVLLLGVPSWADETDLRRGLANLCNSPKDWTTVSIKKGQEGRVYETLSSLATRPSRWYRRSPWSLNRPGVGSDCLKKSSQNASAVKRQVTWQPNAKPRQKSLHATISQQRATSFRTVG